MSTPWKKIKTSSDAARKLIRLQGIATEPGLNTDNLNRSDEDIRKDSEIQGGVSGKRPKRRHRVKYPSPAKPK